MEPVFTEPVKAQLVAALDSFGVGLQGNPEGTRYSGVPVARCQLCGAARHKVKWAQRLTLTGKIKTSGSQCYSCLRACILLGCTRSHVVLSEVPEALKVVKLKSLQIRNELSVRGDNLCLCHECKEVKS